MAVSAAHKARRALARNKKVVPFFFKSNICFYTGLELAKCRKEAETGTWKRIHKTLEHLLPQASIKEAGTGHYPMFFRVINEVPCAQFMNVLVGNAPLKVKFALKAHLAKFTVFPKMSIDNKIEAYTAVARAFLEGFKVHGQYPWQFKTCRNAERRKEMRMAYMSLLTAEEIALGAFVKG